MQICFPVLDERNAKLDLWRKHECESMGRTTEEREKREEDLAEHRDCLSSQLYNCYAHHEKVEHSSGKNKYNTTNH